MMQYNLVTTKGYFRYSDICFGQLNSLPVPIASIIGEQLGYNSHIPSVIFGGTFIEAEDIVAIDYPLSQAADFDSMSHEDTLVFWESEILTLLSELTIYKGGWLYNDKERVVRVLASQPYDRMMTLLFLIRNLTYHSNVGRAYKELRSKGFSCLESAVGCHFCALSYGFGANNTPSPSRIGEYNWFNPQTMSLSSTISLLKQESVNWYGCNFNDSESGYVRDYTFYEDDQEFMNFIGEEDYDGYYDEDDDDEYPLNGRYYKLVDVFSNKEDYNPPMPTIQRNPLNGGHCVSLELSSYDQFIEVFRELTLKAKQ